MTKDRYTVGNVARECAVLLALLHCTLLAVAAVPWRSRGPVTGFVARTTGIVAEKYVAAFGMTQQWYFFTRLPYTPEERFVLAGLTVDSMRTHVRDLDSSEAEAIIKNPDSADAKTLCSAHPGMLQLAVLAREFQIFDDPSFRAAENIPSANWYERVAAVIDCRIES